METSLDPSILGTIAWVRLNILPPFVKGGPRGILYGTVRPECNRRVLSPNGAFVLPAFALFKLVIPLLFPRGENIFWGGTPRPPSSLWLGLFVPPLESVNLRGNLLNLEDPSGIGRIAKARTFSPLRER